MKKSQSEVLAPFNLDKCLKIARSQRDGRFFFDMSNHNSILIIIESLHRRYFEYEAGGSLP